MNLKIFSPTEYIQILNENLQNFSAVIEGEISEYKVNQGKWIFFKIKDENSVLECFSTVFQLKTPLEDGMQVRLFGRPAIYAKSGRFSLNVQWAEPSGEGALKRAFELLKAELEKEGMFSLSRKRKIPKFPKRIGLIASKESAAYKDFIKVLNGRFGGIEIYLYHVLVQGEGSVESIVSAFEYFNEKQSELQLDLMCLIRGGGSLEDLKSFNSREVAYAVFGSLAPVVCGVGHEQDVSIADLIADVRASTPSNAAELIVPQRDDVIFDINGKIYGMDAKLGNLLSGAENKVNIFVGVLDRFILTKINDFKNKHLSMLNHLNIFEERMNSRKVQVDNFSKMSLKIFSEKVTMQKVNVDGFIRLLNNLSPNAILKRGYSIASIGGKIISKIGDIQESGIVNIKVSDGEFDSKVLKIKNR